MPLQIDCQTPLKKPSIFKKQKPPLLKNINYDEGNLKLDYA